MNEKKKKKKIKEKKTKNDESPLYKEDARVQRGRSAAASRCNALGGWGMHCKGENNNGSETVHVPSQPRCIEWPPCRKVHRASAVPKPPPEASAVARQTYG